MFHVEHLFISFSQPDYKENLNFKITFLFHVEHQKKRIFRRQGKKAIQASINDNPRKAIMPSEDFFLFGET